MDLEGRGEGTTDFTDVRADSTEAAQLVDSALPIDETALPSSDFTDVRADSTEAPQRADSALLIDETALPSSASVASVSQSVDTQPISIIRPRVKVGANGGAAANGNGNGNGAAPPAQTHSLRLFLPRSHDFDADVRLMQTVDRVLRESAGDADVIIHMPNAIGTVLLKPRHRVSCDASLVSALRDVLGMESVVVE
jgi:DNA polymerase-3 subunit alpha